VYTLGIREAKMAKNKGCICENERIFDDSGILTHWNNKPDAQRWPILPKTLTYEIKHSSTSVSPYCIYALVHNTFVTASSLTDKDEKKFRVREVRNDYMFTNYAKKLKDTKAEAAALQKKLSLCHVVPKTYIDAELSSLQDTVNGIIFPALMERSDNLCQIMVNLQHAIQGFVSNFKETNEVFEVQEERQLNTWFDDILGPILRFYGYEKRESFPDNKCCIFGSSRPDLVFSKHGPEDLVEAVVVELPESREVEETEKHCCEVDLVQGTIEYKKKSVAKHNCQCYADMIRVANDSVIRSLENGVLVKSVTVYALLLTSHNNLNCVPMIQKYYCNFKDNPTIQVGIEGNFAELLYCILQC